MSQIMGAGGGGALVPANFADSPSPSVSLTAVPGTAVTAKRSDEVLALDQTAAYAFSGLGKTVVSKNAAAATTPFSVTGTWLTSTATLVPQVLIQDSGVAIPFGGSTTGTALGINAPSGFGGDFINAQIGGGAAIFKVNSIGSVTAGTAALSTAQTGTGASGYLFWNTRAAMRSPTTSSITFENNAGSAINTLGIPSTGTWTLGGDPAASPVAQTVQGQPSRSGTDSNVAGANLTVTSGQGTGNATGSSLIFQTPTAVASGTGAQTMTTRLTLNTAGATVVGAVTADGGLLITNLFVINTANLRGNSNYYFGLSSASDNSTISDVVLSRAGPAAWRLGGPGDSASPVAQTLQAQGSRAGTDSNVGGANLTINSGQGTGTGTGSDIIFQTPALVASGSGAQTMTAALTIKGTTQKVNAASTINTGGYTVSTLPAGAVGDRAYVTDASAPAFGSAVVGGGAVKIPVYYDGAWKVG